MKTALALPIALLLGGCGDSDTGANAVQPKAVAANVTAPINDTVAAIADRTPLRPPRASQTKPLVSRETSPVRSTAPDYRAIGTEPFWGVTLRGSTVTLERPDHPPRRFAIRDESGDRAIRFVGEGFTLTATPGPCSDGMSDAIWSDRVQIAFADGTLKGCGGRQEDSQADRREAPF